MHVMLKFNFASLLSIVRSCSQSAPLEQMQLQVCIEQCRLKYATFTLLYNIMYINNYAILYNIYYENYSGFVHYLYLYIYQALIQQLSPKCLVASSLQVQLRVLRTLKVAKTKGCLS